MKALTDRFVPQQRSPSPPTPLVSSDSEHSDNKCTLWSTSSSVSQPYREPSSTSGRKQLCAATWTSLVKKVSMASGAIKRFQDRVLGPNRIGLPSTTSDFWLLGVCYKLSEDEETDDGSVVAALKQDFSSRILMTYRKGLYYIFNLQTQAKFIAEYSPFYFFLQALNLSRTQVTPAM